MLSYLGPPRVSLIVIVACLLLCSPGCLCTTSNTQPSLLSQQARRDFGHQDSQLDPNSIPNTRPGYKWDQFLTIPELTSNRRSVFQAFLAGLLPSWLRKLPRNSSNELTQLSEMRETEPVELNNATWVPILPAPIAWMMHNAEDRIAKAGVNLPKAQLLAKLTSVSYCQRNNIQAWNCSRCTSTDSLRHFWLTTTVYDVTWDLFAYAGYSTASELGGGAIVVAFRGTDSHSLYNWVENMRYWKTDYDIPYPGSEGALVHTGFFMSYNASDLAPNITRAVRALREEYPNAPLYVAGHSMGAAMAHICALDLKFTLGFDNVNVYTYGSPRVGNTIFKDFFNNMVNESVRVTHNRDIVPSVPPQYVGFHHVSREVWQLDGAQYFGSKVYMPWACDGSGEDPVCHNSVCYLGLCTSISDHMHYMGANMYHRNSAPC